MRLLIADDHVLLREALKALLEAAPEICGMQCVGSYGEAREAIAGADPAFDLALLDLGMPGMQGIGSAVELMQAFPQTRVALMSGSAEPGLALAAMNAGLNGFIPKTISGRALENVVKLIACGETYFPASMLQAKLTPDALGGGLSADEAGVLAQLKEGATNKEIALYTGLDEFKVKSIVRRLAARLGARNRTEIALRAADLIS